MKNVKSGYTTFINAITVGLVAGMTYGQIVGGFTFALSCVTLALLAKGWLELSE